MNRSFYAIKSWQGNRQNYLIQLPLEALEKLFHFPEVKDLSKSYQRPINEKRKESIADYLNSNDNFILPSVVAFPIFGDFTFEISSDRGLGGYQEAGIINLSPDCKLGLFDGQHRVSGVIEALKNGRNLSGGCIPVMLLEKPSLQASQQIFSDINLNAVKPSQSIKLFFNNRDRFSKLTKYVIDETPLLKQLVDFGSSNLPKHSEKLFSYSAVYGAVVELYKGLDGSLDFEQRAELIVEFFMELSECLLPFLDVYDKKISAFDLRESSIAPFAVTLQAFGNVGFNLINQHKVDWKQYLHKIINVSFLKSTPVWINRVIVKGQIKKSRTNSILIANVVLETIGEELKGENRITENKYLNYTGGDQ